MTPSEQLTVDTRWTHAMDGLRVATVYGRHPRSIHGEVTGYDHETNNFSVVFDGEDEPCNVYWHHLRPA